MSQLFLSYRKSDTGPYADGLARQLQAFQFDTVFLDRQSIPLGSDYADRIRTALAASSAALVLIGKNWVVDPEGRRRLDDADDWVRREIAIALGLKLPVVPLFFDNVPALKADDLPAELAPLAHRQGYSISGEYFERDAKDLASRIERLVVGPSRPSPSVERAGLAHALLGQLKIIWIVLFLITIGAAVAHSFFPILEPIVWALPLAMTVAAFVWWLACLSSALGMTGLRSS